MKRLINTGSIRVRFFLFIGMLLLILLLLLNLYPYVSARDAVYQEKERSMESRAATLASALAGLSRPDEENVAEVLRLLDVRDYDRVTFADSESRVIYDSAGPAGVRSTEADLLTALEGKTVFRSALQGTMFLSSYAIPVSAQGAITGAVYLRETDRERGDILHRMQFQIRTVSIIIAAASLFMAFMYSRLVLRKIQDLSASMRVVAGGNYRHRMQTSGTDELAELGREFNELTERLEDTERQRQRFVADASHELKTPLASIRLLSDSIVQNENMDEATVREFVTDIGSEAERLQRTTEKLLDLSRLDDDIQVVPEPVDLRQVTLDALVFLLPLAEENRITVTHALDDGCVVLATVDDIFHIVFNLVENAVKYNLPGGSVKVGLRAEGETVLLTVEDTGIGIPEDERYNIFSRFYRVDKARSREAGGSGLGLSIVHDAIKAHGGSIAVGPNQPRGSRFIVSFPRFNIERT